LSVSSSLQRQVLAYLTGRPRARRLAAGSRKMVARERIMNSA
jgi:hypothetical protein